MTDYFAFHNPPPSRDVQADIDRIPDHFARIAAIEDRRAAEHTPAQFYRCTHCEWLGTLDEAEDDASIGPEATLCPECFSHIEPNEADE